MPDDVARSGRRLLRPHACWPRRRSCVGYLHVWLLVFSITCRHLLLADALLWPFSDIDSWIIGRVAETKFSSREFFATSTNKSSPSVCFDHLGCFSPGPGPLRKRLSIVPREPKKVATRIWLFTSENRLEPEAIDWLDPAPLLRSKFDRTRRSVFYSHGFMGSGDAVSSMSLKDAFTKTEQVNFFLVDWRHGAQENLYAQAAANAEVVGRQIALLIATIMDHFAYSHTNFYLVGFSLGAHIAGFAATHFRTVLRPGLSIPRITGLDPAGPEFYDGDYPDATRLDPSDADYVDVIHTNGGHLATGHLSTLTPVGHVDYYPNGGSRQPGCSIAPISDLEVQFTTEGQRVGQCNHARSWQLYAASVSDPGCDFHSFPCSGRSKLSAAVFGLSVQKAESQFYDGECFKCDTKDVGSACGKMGRRSIETPARGLQLLVTLEGEPYCGLMYRISVKSSKRQPEGSATTTRGQLLVTLFNGISELDTAGPRPLFGNNATRLTAGDSKSAVVLLPRPGVSFDQEAIRARIVYVPSPLPLITGSEHWGVDSIEVTDQNGNRRIAHLRSVLQAGQPIEFALPKPGNGMTLLNSLFPQVSSVVGLVSNFLGG